jgi:hypothetical protein
MFTAHGIDVVVAAEHHAGLLGGLGAAFLALDLWVASDDAEEAAALLHDLRERDASDSHEALVEIDDDASDDDDSEPGASLQQRIDRRRQTGVALLLGCCVTFGTAHVLTGSWARGIGLAALELFGIFRLAGGHALGGVAVAVAILADVTGAVWRVRAATRPALPAARVHTT